MSIQVELGVANTETGSADFRRRHCSSRPHIETPKKCATVRSNPARIGARVTFRLTRSNNTASCVRALKPPRLAQGVIQSGIPENLTPGYWNVVCQCCGSATVIDLSIGLWVAIGRKDYLALHSALQVNSGNPFPATRA